MGPDERASSATRHAERAATTFDSLQRAYYDGRSGLYRKRRRLGWRPFEVLWPFANAWASTCSLAAVPSPGAGSPDPGTRAAELLATRIPALLRYAPRGERHADGPVGFGSTVHWPLWSPISRRLWRAGTVYYDDNEWLALALVHQHHLYAGRDCLELARRIFAFVVTGWCDVSGWSRPGGIRWADARWSLGRNTCSNGPAAEVGAELFLLTGDRTYLDWAVRIYEWVHGALVGEDGLYADHLRPDGRVVPAIWSYNQGSMIGAGTLLYRATGDGAYIDEAARTAGASLGRYASLDVLVDEPPIFVAVYLRNLLLLDALRPDPRYRALARSYEAALWERHAGVPLRSSGVNETVPLIAVESMLAGSAPHP